MYMSEPKHHTPHFHANYNERYCVLPDLKILAGSLPKRALSQVKEWAELHKNELMINWKNIVDRQRLNKIKPLE